MDSKLNTKKNEIVTYRSKDGETKLGVKIGKETVWLTQKQIAALFSTERSVITKHLRNIFASKELSENSVCANFAHTALDGKTYHTKFYNLDAIISVGYRVNSQSATQFRIWATKILKDYLVKGYTLNQKKLAGKSAKLKELQTTINDTVPKKFKDKNKFKEIYDIWNKHKKNSNENFWHELFKTNPWIIEQIFPCPVEMLDDKCYIGGKGINDKGGRIVDFIYLNKLAENIILVEIKTPVTKLLGADYRNGTYSESVDLSGAKAQMLKYKDECQKNSYSLETKSKRKFKISNPECLVIIGNLENLSEEQKQSFEFIRRDSKDVDIRTFDGVFKKIELLIALIDFASNFERPANLANILKKE